MLNFRMSRTRWLPYMGSEAQVKCSRHRLLAAASSGCRAISQALVSSLNRLLVAVCHRSQLLQCSCCNGASARKARYHERSLHKGVANLLAKAAQIGQRHQPCRCYLRRCHVLLVSVPCCIIKHTLHLLQPSQGISDAQLSTGRPCTSPLVQLCNTSQVTCKAGAGLPLLAEPEDLSAQGQVRRHALQVVHAHKLPIAQLHLAVPV